MKNYHLMTTVRRIISHKAPLRRTPAAPTSGRSLIFLGLAVLAMILVILALALLPFADLQQRARDLVAIVLAPPVSATRASGSAMLSGSPTPVPSSTPTVIPCPTPVPTITPTATPAGPCPPPPGWELYTVRAGDTLTALAQSRGTTVHDLVQANCLTSLMIYVGQTLYLPVLHPPTPANQPTALAVSPAVPTATPQPLSLPAGAAERLALPPEIINVILLGSDSRVQGGLGRTDTMILVAINPVSKTVSMLSIPRDLWVYIPTCGYERINTAYMWGTLSKYPGGGPALVKATIEYNFGVPVHYYAAIDLKGFIRLIDTLGGVTIAVECPFPDLELEPGIHHMDGQWALAYARSRITSSDFARSRRQQQVLRAMWAQLLRPETILQIPSLWSILQDSITTDLSLEQIISLAQLGLQINTRQIQSLYLDGEQVKAWVTPQGGQVLLPQPAACRALFAALFTPPGEVELIHARVEIRNAGCTSFQAKELAADRLYYLGFDNVRIGPDQPEVRPRTIIVNYTNDAEAIALLRQAFHVPAEDVWFQAQENPPLDALVLLGRNFNPCQQ